MFTVEFAPKAERQISKLEESSRLAVKKYLKEKVQTWKKESGIEFVLHKIDF